MKLLQGRSARVVLDMPQQQVHAVCRPVITKQRYLHRCQNAAASAAAAAAVALALHGSIALGPAWALEQQQGPALCPSQPVVMQPQQQREQQQRQQEGQQQQQQEQQQQQQQQRQLPGWLPVAELAGFFDNADPTDPFTLYGTNFKKYEIEQMQGEKVVSRSRGFTVDTCVSGKAAAEESPIFNGLSTGAKVEAGDDLLCKRATGPDLKVACKQSCGTACESALAAYEARLTAETGLVLDAKERGRVLKNCRHSCSYECTKSGKSHDFVVPSRR